MNNNRIQTTELDFDGIKNNLKNFLKGQQQFSDYDFEGSGLSVLLDILAYNTHYNALYTNLAVNEAFLDSAAKRSSVVSKAKELGYVPKSATASTAVVTVSMLNDQLNAPTTIEIPIYTPFSSQVGGVTYTFYSTATHTAIRNGNQYIFQNVELKEGQFLQNIYVYDGSTPIIIPNTGVDRTTIKVTVQESVQSSITQVFVESSTVLSITPSTNAYFLKELDNQTYEIEFGNGVLGRALSPGNVVTISYLVCNNDLPNGARQFNYAGTLPTNTTPYVTVTSIASGGSAPEDIDQIRWNAPRAYAAQNRCVTSDDYVTLIKSLYTKARAVNVWGGEQNNPPEYGKVFISVVPTSGETLPDYEKQYIIDEIINPRKPLSLTPVLMDPKYIKVGIHTTFYYDPRKTTRSYTDIKSLVAQTITDYDTANLSNFGGVFKFSKLSSLIDQTEPSITSNITTVLLYRDVTPVYNISNTYNITLGNPIYNSGVAEESILSTGFTTVEISNVCYIDDLPSETNIGALRMFYFAPSGEKVTVKIVGTVNYNTGEINIIDLNIIGLNSNTFTFAIKPQSNDVVGNLEQFVTIDPTLLNVNGVIDSAYQAYTFTSSRT